MKRVIVLGAQRSGTNIAAAIIAKDRNLPLHSERDLGYSSCVLTGGSESLIYEFMNNTDSFVLQAPSMNVFAHQINQFLDEPVSIVWVNRDIDDVRKSRSRVNWEGEGKELDKYLDNFEWFFRNRYCKDSVDMCLRVWNEYQKILIGDFEEIEYESLKGHELWKDERSEIGIGDT